MTWQIRWEYREYDAFGSNCTADLNTMEKYFPLLDAADNGAATKGTQAYLEDKIESAKYHYQAYATQLDRDEKSTSFHLYQ